MSRSRLKSASDAAALGLTFPACTLAGYFLGHWLDSLFSTGRALSYAGGLLGSAAAFVSLYRIAQRAASDDEKEKPD